MNRLSPLAFAALLLGSNTASAQEINAQRFEPAVDGRTFLVLTDPQVGRRGIGGSMTFNYADDPFIFRYENEDKADVALLDAVATTNLTTFANLGPARLGVDVPLHLASSGYAVEGFRLVGDLGLDAKIAVLDRQEKGVGLGARARLGLPTGNGSAWLGDARPTLGLEVASSVGERFMGAANLGLRLYPGGPVQLPEVAWGNRLTWGVGGKVPIWDFLWATAEVNGELIFGSAGATGAVPIEGLVAVRGNPIGDLIASLGAGTGFTKGIGAPDFRFVASVAWVPGTARDLAENGGNDRDGDGIADARDLCPDQAEDMNGIADDDGCPDNGLTPTRLTVLDPEGAQVANARVELLEGPETGTYSMLDGELMRSLPPGTYRVRAGADDFLDAESTLVVPESPKHEATLRVVHEAPTGTVTITVMDEKGLPVVASARLLGADKTVATESDGVGHDTVPAGTWEIVVSAPNYQVARRTLRVDPDGASSLDVMLQPARVVVAGDRVVIMEKIFFEFDSAVIMPESFGILDEVVGVLREHGEIELIEVQGHTDSQGEADYNRKLSQKRAEAVSAYLTLHGVDPSRLTARGYGEDQPLQPGETEEAWAANRRVEFLIRRRAASNPGSP